ncbi:hypothetical protein A2U01_0034077 [Trifolium medium]|uniref:Transposase-associated domain-containing protein n=1 Tax=Trifolium medium TaxID=97028 RepID=A0A392PNU5_9FABA|nr:hypothetical protein [Trifolium medium]
MYGLIQNPKDVIHHLGKVGFMNDYYVWRHHGEQELPNINAQFDVNTHTSSSGAHTECENFGGMEGMVGDALGVNLSYKRDDKGEIIPNEKALKFYSMMEEVNEPLFEGSSWKYHCTQMNIGTSMYTYERVENVAIIVPQNVSSFLHRVHVSTH